MANTTPARAHLERSGHDPLLRYSHTSIAGMMKLVVVTERLPTRDSTTHMEGTNTATRYTPASSVTVTAWKYSSLSS